MIVAIAELELPSLLLLVASSLEISVLTKALLAIILFKHSVTESPPAGSPISMVSLISKCRNKCGVVCIVLDEAAGVLLMG